MQLKSWTYVQKIISSIGANDGSAYDKRKARFDASWKWFAHSGKLADFSDWQPLNEHLTAVANLASHRAKVFGAEDWAFLIGLLHDLGKYTQEFQARLYGDSTRADHATAGAKQVMRHLTNTYGNTPSVQAMAKLMAFAIAGHHAGLANGVEEGQERSTLKQRLAKDIPALNEVWQREISLPQRIAVPPLKTHSNPEKYANFHVMFLTRMLFSCLIDADRIDTENYTRRIDGRPELKSKYPNIKTLQTQLKQHLQQLGKRAKPTDVNVLRQHILHHARQVAIQPNESGLYSLTVPTGGGKTLTSLAFGLDHAAQHQLRRVIYVIPFTSIIEQTADVFRSALGESKDAVLEHHCAFDRDKLPEEIKKQSKPRQADYRDKLRLTMESWDAPIVVTTAVQFFESLFSDRPSQCRKLHNIAGSVIVLDEAQTLPRKLLRPIMAVIDELALNYGCSVVLCTATQPALKDHDGFHNGFQNVKEIAPNPFELFEKLRRAQIKSVGEKTDDELTAHLRSHTQVLMIVNNRRHARELFDAIANEEGAYHLTTAMCAEHRSQKLKEIRLRLQNGQACRLVATSLIEAGVDVDFPIVYRAEAGLDSIAQAAGRCNREGRQSTKDSQVLVFQSSKWKTPPELAQLAAPMRSIFRTHEGDVLVPDALKSYFQQVYYAKGADLDHHQILKKIRTTEGCDFPFQNIARDFRMIDSNMLPIIVPFDDVAKEGLNLLRRLPENMSVATPSKKLQRYVVRVPEKPFVQLLKLGAIEAVATEKFGNQFYELIAESLYCQIAGLNLTDLTAISAESSVFA
jgi:CRISPR-associated endonuclease/helicase Cas3